MREIHPELGYIGKAVKRIAFSKDINLTKVCRRSGISESSFYAVVKVERDELSRAPSLDLFFAIADGLEVTPGYLLDTMVSEFAKEQGEGEEGCPQ